MGFGQRSVLRFFRSINKKEEYDKIYRQISGDWAGNQSRLSHNNNNKHTLYTVYIIDSVPYKLVSLSDISNMIENTATVTS